MIDWSKALTAVGVGVADELVGDWDESVTPARVEPFKTAQDIGRLIAALGGWAATAFFPRYARLGETMGIAATPLLVKSVWNAVAAQQATKGRVAHPNRSSRRFPSNTPTVARGKDAGSRYPAPVYQNEFKKIQLF